MNPCTCTPLAIGDFFENKIGKAYIVLVILNSQYGWVHWYVDWVHMNPCTCTPLAIGDFFENKIGKAYYSTSDPEFTKHQTIANNLSSCSCYGKQHAMHGSVNIAAYVCRILLVCVAHESEVYS